MFVEKRQWNAIVVHFNRKIVVVDYANALNSILMMLLYACIMLMHNRFVCTQRKCGTDAIVVKTTVS